MKDVLQSNDGGETREQTLVKVAACKQAAEDPSDVGQFNDFFVVVFFCNILFGIK